MSFSPYRLLRPVLFRMAPETAHHVAFAGIQLAFPLLPRRAVRPGSRPAPLRRGLPAPFGLAAGFDKDARGARAWGKLGFGFAEIGTITPRPQPGNPSPRLFRLPEDEALINRMGFNNEGVARAGSRLRGTARPVPIGANIGKNKTTTPESAVDDYRACALALSPVADFLVVNVSSPNTPGLRDLQAVATLEPILASVAQASTVPVLVKIAPDLAEADIEAVADLAARLKLAGLVACNTTIGRAGLRSDPALVQRAGAGGLSGPILAKRALEVLRLVRSATSGSLALVSVGGVRTAQDAWERIRAGASLVEGYTGFIYEGPLYARRINRGLAKLVREHGFATIAEAVGGERA
ncbi:quinone-dependent dihydroorotate dehydrogenase [Segniliparus rugosus]|uniref:Dihydroorotate dehydrogenase (quinone) n=1 Tax=Segniliparus rugosus (strain ATCC BAA-974 / DSM 45345 / CCUG 50838 / CIP 108380 / JCM 13579 / CDC 945) TaxID=679197 RepID=U1N8M0_SEGRC|nr:quinone-dependent dihydroorotate dehydrogenase [Segniliparus rugosus]ERG69188.1 dihydroorotate oxidase [Segniliparus rugosus ATCC BAA-974]